MLYDNKQNQDACKQPSAAPPPLPLSLPLSLPPCPFLLSCFLDPRQLPCHMPVLKPSCHLSCQRVDPQHIIILHPSTVMVPGVRVMALARAALAPALFKSVLTGTRQGVISMWGTALCG